MERSELNDSKLGIFLLDLGQVVSPNKNETDHYQLPKQKWNDSLSAWLVDGSLDDWLVQTCTS